jgi:hypothetical protein
MEGEEIVFRPPNYETQGKFGDYLAEESIKDICRHRRVYDPDMLLMALSENNKAITAKEYSWKRAGWLRCMDDWNHMKRLAAMVMCQLDEGGKPINKNMAPDVAQELLNTLWEQPYVKEGDLLYETAIAQGQTLTYREKIVDTLWGLILRPNSSTPDQPGMTLKPPSLAS